MRLADDDRGRVPFALVGVLLLTGASVYATGVADRAQPSIERPATAAMDDVVRDARPALSEAIRRAAREAAREPVTEPAETAAGRALDDSQPYVDALRLRIALAARESLSGVNRERGAIEAHVDLPAVDGSTASLRRAKSAIAVVPVDGGAAIQVTVRNLTIRATERGQTVAQRRQNVTLTVETPVLALHQRTREYERRLNRGALAGDGLARGLTTRLTAIAMARGNARYAGAPIRNVLANRHVELSTNAALLAQQRAVFGRHDPAGARAVDVATVEVGVLDLLGDRHGDAAAATNALLNPNAVEGVTDPAAGEFDPQQPSVEPISTDPGAAADRAYLDAISGSSTAGSYRVRSELSVGVLSQSSARGLEPTPENWTLLDREHSERTVVTTLRDPETESSGTVVDTIRKVTIHHTLERRWRHNGTTRTTTAEWTETARVAVRVKTAYAPTDAAPDRPTVPLFERGGALGGPNLVGAREQAADALIDANGGVDAVAARAVANGGENGVVDERTATAARPSALDAWIAADLRGLRGEVANVTVSVPRSAIASGDANAPARLAEKLRDRRRELLAVPATYDGAADRARVAARVAYFDRVLTELDARAADARGRNLDYRDELGDRTTAELSELIELGRAEAGTFGGAKGYEQPATDEDEPVLTPDGAPAYLTLGAIDHEQEPSVPPGASVHPLTARTTNWVAVPYGDAANGVVDALLGGGTRKVSLESAAGTLIAANRTVGAGGDGAAGASAALTTNRDELAAAVGSSVARAEAAVCEAATNGTGVRRSPCQGAVVEARERWPTLGHRGRAMANGSYAPAFESALTGQGIDAATADEAAVRVRVRLRRLDEERATNVPAATVNRTASVVKRAAREVARKQVSGALENASAKATRRLTGASRLPAGLPVAPPPYTWIATVNAWSVTVRGEYQRFAVRARAPTPDGTGSTVRYVRDGSAVRLDVDGDGDRERLGRGERVGFEASTTIVAVVPPGMPGVGDVDGNRDETAPGWPCPGVDDERCTADEPE